MGLVTALRAKALLLKGELVALYVATRDRRTPVAAKLLVLLVIAYAVSPVDVIPDFIPVLGLLDDVVLIPLGIALAIRMIPHEVMRDARAAAPRAVTRLKRLALLGLAIVVAVWAAVAVFVYLGVRALG